MQKKIIGLTGQSGAGKSTAAKMFKDNKFYIVDADRVAKEITAQTETAIILSNIFGKQILNSDNSLNRRALADIVFTNQEALNALNNTLFPMICKEINQRVQWAPNTYVVLDAPQLFESGLNKICDSIVAMIAPREILIERICKRDGITEDDAKNRLNSQLNEDFFIKNANYIIKSDGDYVALKHRVDAISRDIRKEVDVFEF